MNKTNIINLISFQLLWLVCVQAVNWLAILTLLCFLGIHFLLVAREKAEYLLIVVFLLLGFAIESTINTLGLIHYSKSSQINFLDQPVLLAPIWLLCLWAGFATTFFHSLAWLKTRPLLTVLLVSLSIPVSYYLGAKLSGSIFAASTPVALTMITLIWLAVIPLSFSLITRLRKLTDNEQAHAFFR